MTSMDLELSRHGILLQITINRLTFLVTDIKNGGVVASYQQWMTLCSVVFVLFQRRAGSVCTVPDVMSAMGKIQFCHFVANNGELS